MLHVFEKEDIQYGGGAYAFVSKDGANLLFLDPVFESFIQKSSTETKYHLVIGTDAITNVQAIDALKELTAKYPHLKIQAFIHKRDGTTFHPKFSWFKLNKGGILVIGSPNLTQKALRSNKESYSVIELDDEELEYVEKTWNDWLNESMPDLYNLDTAEVANRCTQNHLESVEIRKIIRKLVAKASGSGSESGNTGPDSEDSGEGDTGCDQGTPRPHEPETTEIEAWYYSENSEVLIAEIPKADKRWKQANFDLSTFTNFFGATPTDPSTRRMVTCIVNKDGRLGDTKSRPSVSVKSKNYRVELDVPNSTPYPETGRVIGIFIKQAKRNFLYALSMPGDADHDSLQAYVDDLRQRPDRCVRTITNLEKLREVAPNCPLLNYCVVPEELTFNDVF